MRWHPGIAVALTAAGLFGIGTPLSKLLLAEVSPWLLAALLYLGSGIGLWLMRQIRRSPKVHLDRGDWRWLAAATVAGGMIAPVLLMLGLSAMPASGASLLLNAEGVLTALLAWFVFHENFDRRIALGMLAIVAGALVLSWPSDAQFSGAWPALAILGACFAWAIDNNLTRKVALADASFIAMVKGLVAGTTNLALALLAGATWPAPEMVVLAALLGFASYGASLTLFVIALRHLGTARTGAYFSIAPFFGTLLAILLLNEPVTPQLLAAGLLMAVGVWLHLSERHEHGHRHEALEHTHEHVHGKNDAHHDHEHSLPVLHGTRHTHRHQHAPIEHAHAHFPDAHHPHKH
ncbi:DMT family transporter [Dechloromonas sp. A34]|uniref:DMT family transporter n=1 Tax=Dechloromonas sp. A34 TaxID=447588 RepID=UPI002248C62A|nr:DMT family transporter [Dechloromonas sp. A34]